MVEEEWVCGVGEGRRESKDERVRIRRNKKIVRILRNLPISRRGDEEGYSMYKPSTRSEIAEERMSEVRRRN